MRTKLEQLTLDEYLDLLCGDLSVIAHGDMVQLNREKVRRDILFEFQSICDSGALKRVLVKGFRQTKAKTLVAILTICEELIKAEEFDDARKILAELKINVSSMSEERLQTEIAFRLAKAKKDLSDKNEDEEREISGEDIRKSFARQTALLMSHFKFQIDTATMKANLYANLVRQFDDEIKAQKETLSRFRKK